MKHPPSGRRLATGATSKSAASSATSNELLAVALHRALVADLRLVGIFAAVAEAAPLSQEIPTLVEGDLDPLQPIAIVVWKWLAFAPLTQPVLLGYQLVDAVDEILIVHPLPCCS
jgi:hypothetical protein